MLGAYSFVEGWAHYGEQMMIEEGFGAEDPQNHLGQLSDALHGRIQPAPSAVELVRNPDEKPCDAVITDLRMPGVDGLALLDLLRVSSMSPAPPAADSR